MRVNHVNCRPLQEPHVVTLDLDALDDNGMDRGSVRAWLEMWGHLAYWASSHAHKKGFHSARMAHLSDMRVLSDSTALMLVVTEIAEAQEGLRKPGPSDKIPEYTIVEEELADAIIRIMDLGSLRAHRVAEAVLAKLVYNATRPDMHGGKSV